MSESHGLSYRSYMDHLPTSMYLHRLFKIDDSLGGAAIMYIFLRLQLYFTHVGGTAYNHKSNNLGVMIIERTYIFI